jgi:hypothetical protein
VASEPVTGVRVPAAPLIVHDPYLSVWLVADTTTERWPAHWSGRNMPICGMARIDGQPFRFLGRLTPYASLDLPPMAQVALEVLPTRTVVTLAAAGVELTLTFTSPALPDDLDLVSWPLTWVNIAVRATDGATHAVELYLDVAGSWAVHHPQEQVVWGRHRAGPVTSLWVGSRAQPVLETAGDEVLIDWGYLHVAADPAMAAAGALGEGLTLRETFAATGTIPDRDDVGFGGPLGMPAPAASGTAAGGGAGDLDEDRPPLVVAAWATSLGQVGGTPAVWALAVAYDQGFAVEWLHRRLRPYWRRGGRTAIGLIEEAWARRAEVAARCATLDATLLADAEAAGGADYARLCALAFRQCLGAHALVADADGTPLHFSKENSSNGCMATVDVTYPAAPFFLLLNPALLEAQLEPVCRYAASGRWPFPYAPHDVGRFPLANGQVYGGAEHSHLRQMPVEECGNMLILAAALARARGTAAFAARHWALLERWAGFLAEHGLDPASQLCTDDFAGHLARNVNLSAKAIVALGAFAQLADTVGRPDTGRRFRELAEAWVGEWCRMADDGEHYRLTFDGAGTWSQKYNLVWDLLLDLELFPAEVRAREVAHYLREQRRYGVPLDSRHAYTKLDWILWSACLAEREEDFRAMIEPIARFLDDTPDRVPLTDWYDTETSRTARRRGFRARSVVGGVLVKLLLERGRV